MICSKHPKEFTVVSRCGTCDDEQSKQAAHGCKLAEAVTTTVTVAQADDAIVALSLKDWNTITGLARKVIGGE